MLSILFVDDDEVYTRMLTAHLNRAGYNVDVAVTLQEGVQKLNVSSYNLVLLDLNLDDSSGASTLRELAKSSKGTPIICLTGANGPELKQELLTSGAIGFINKTSINYRKLSEMIETAVNQPSALQVYLDRLDTIIEKLKNGNGEPSSDSS